MDVMDWLDKCHFGDCRDTMHAMIADGVKVQTIVTSPPYYGLRDYGHPGQLGLEETPEAYIAAMVDVFRCARDLLADDGTLWLNIGDSYAGSWGSQGRQGNTGQMAGRSVVDAREKSKIQAARIEAGAYPAKKTRTGAIPEDSDLKPKDLIGIPWMLAFALRADGWYLRQEIIWHKPNPMPESVRDRCTKAHESLFLLAKSEHYFYDADAVSEAAVSDHDAGNHSHKAATAYEGGATEHRTKAGLVAYAQRTRTQTQRAVELAQQHGLTDEHIAAIRAVGITDVGKAQTTQDGFGKNDPKVQALADEAKAALGGYYREFLIAERRNRRSVWSIPTMPYKGAHFAVFPEALVEPCVLAGSRVGDIVFDPFFGSGTSGQVASRLGRRFIGCELNRGYEPLQRDRLKQPGLILETN
jgi:site-specific DNA-methyltransferase (cytosine-N4-specific)